MEKLSTIQKRENLNEVFSADERGPGGACHRYMIAKAGKLTFDDKYITAEPEDIIGEIRFQYGPRAVTESKHGIIDTDLLEIVRDRLKSFQANEFATWENAIALTHIEEALMWMNRRVEDRIERNVLGTMGK